MFYKTLKKKKKSSVITSGAEGLKPLFSLYRSLGIAIELQAPGSVL